MDEQIARTVSNIPSLEKLKVFEQNARNGKVLDAAMEKALRERVAELCRKEISEKTGLDLRDLTPAEEKIVQAVAEYMGIKRREGHYAGRTLRQIRQHGLTEAAEISVCKSRPTQGFRSLAEADMDELSYERIIVGHPEEFSPRAIWYARRTLGLPNDSSVPPAKKYGLTQTWTETVLEWLTKEASEHEGRLPAFSNSDTAHHIGLPDLQKYGRVIGNLQSRIDFACYRVGLPPLGLCADTPFADAWNQEKNQAWAFPKESMTSAAQSREWQRGDFERILKETRNLSGQAHLLWKDEFAKREAALKVWAFGSANVPATATTATESSDESRRNPPWTRDELIMALDLYLRFRRALPDKTSKEVAELSAFLGHMNRKGDVGGATYRNANGVYMKMMNFRRFDPEFTAEGKVGLSRGNKLEEAVWNEFADDPAALALAVEDIRAGIGPTVSKMPSTQSIDGEIDAEAPYWVFVCNPKKWAIDEFLKSNIEHDSWGVRPSDKERFAPGQLGIVRVGVDRRTAEERRGNPPLEPGIYALCEVEGTAYAGTGASDKFWARGAQREPGWPTVNIRYLRSFLREPLSIERLRVLEPGMSPNLLQGLQASSFPIPANDFRRVVEALGVNVSDIVKCEDGDTTIDKLASLEERYVNAAPEVKERISTSIERGQIGALVKRLNKFKCQVCEALGNNPIGFLKKDGEPYVEAHHVMPVSKKEIGSLSASNVMTVCANHHRQLHYGGVEVTVTAASFELTLGDASFSVPRLRLDQTIADI